MIKFFFMHHLCLGFTCIALFFCIHLAVLQSYLSLFSHITCIHFTKLGTQLDLKIDWLIFEFCTFSICYFYVWIEENIFFEIWWIIMYKYSLLDLSSKDHLFMSHIVSSLHLLKERIFFFMCILNLVFKFGLCLFIYPHLLNFPQNCFSQNLFCFSYFYGGEICF